MNPKWILVCAQETFLQPLESRKSTLLEKFTNTSDVTTLEAALEQWGELKQFITAIRNLQDDTIRIESLPPAYNENKEIIPYYHVLRVKKWSAYYRVDDDQHLCTGMLVRHDADSPVDVLGQALTAAEHRSAKKKG